MKYNIKKLEGGGWATFTPVIYQQPTESTSKSKSESSDKSKNTISSFLDDKVFEDLMGKGLVNDVNSFVNSIMKLESNSINPFLQSGNRSTALKLIGKINEIKQNKVNFDSAVSTAEKNGGYGEIAVDNNSLFAKDNKGNIQQINIKSYNELEDKSNIKLLTVAELMNERQHNPKLTGQNSLFNVANNSIGFDKITDHIKGLVAAIGSVTTEETNSYSRETLNTLLKQYQVSKKPTESEQNSINELQRVLSTPSEYYKMTTKVSNNNQYVQPALRYIWSTLGENAKQKLSAVAASAGVSNPQQFILDMLISTDKTEVKTAIPEKMPGDASGNASGSGSSKTIALTPQELFHNDRLYIPGMTYEINNKTGNTKLNITATGKETLMSLDNNDVVRKSSMDNVLNQHGFGRILNKSQMYIGDTKIEENLLPEIAFTGEDVGKVYLPVIGDGIPDLGKIESFNKAYQKFNEIKNTKSKTELEQFFKTQGFSNVRIVTTENGDKVIAETGAVRPFMAIPIITNSASEVSNLPWMLKSIGKKADLDEILMEEAFTEIGGTPSKPKIIKKAPSSWTALENPYRGVMFVAYRPSSSIILSSMFGHMKGNATSELDVQRNLKFSSGTVSPGGVNTDASKLIQQ